MTSSTNYLVKLVLAVSFLVAANVRADIITVYGTNDVEAYFETAASSHWMFGDLTKIDTKHGQEWGFSLLNTDTDAEAWGTIKSCQHTGNAGGFTFGSTGDPGTMSIAHNTTLVAGITFDLNGIVTTDSFIDSFYFTLAAHDNSHDSFVNVTATSANGESIQVRQQASVGMFFGFTLDEGYFTEFAITITDINGKIKNNGGFDNLLIGLGDSGWYNFVDRPGYDDAATPEPATMLVFGLGLVGLGLARRNRK
jgi:hypothetical protein